MGKIDITLDEIILEMERLSAQSAEGFTMKEMSKHFGRHIQWCRDLMQELINLDKARCVGKKRKTRIDGGAGWVPVYEFIDGDDSPST